MTMMMMKRKPVFVGQMFHLFQSLVCTLAETSHIYRSSMDDIKAMFDQLTKWVPQFNQRPWKTAATISFSSLFFTFWTQCNFFFASGIGIHLLLFSNWIQQYFKQVTNCLFDLLNIMNTSCKPVSKTWYETKHTHAYIWTDSSPVGKRPNLI